MLNAVAALAMANSFGISIQVIAKALLTFKGIKRRFSYKINTENLVLIDDYAHHPTEIDAIHQAVTEMYPQNKKLIVFQPHLFSRTKDFGTEFAKSLSRFDEVILLEIYPAREESIEGISSKWLLDKIANENKKIVAKEDLFIEVKNSNCKVKLMVGAGDIGVEVESITKYLKDED